VTFLKLLFFGFLFGIGFGYFIQRAGLCFAAGLGEIFTGRGKRIARFLIIVFVITSAGFLLSGYISPELGLKPIGQIRGYGFYNLLSGMLFGAGIFLSGGCILGTLRQIGEGNLIFLVVLIAFIPGMTLVVYGLDPLLQSRYAIQQMLLPDILVIPASWITGVLILGMIFWFQRLRRKR
jgi:uncharacterized membrane protein YedE/YeeE